MKFRKSLLASVVVLFVVCLASFIPLRSIADNVSSTLWQVIILSSIPSGASVDSTIHPVVIKGGGIPAGDLCGSFADPIVCGILGEPLPAFIAGNNVLVFNGTLDTWVWESIYPNAPYDVTVNLDGTLTTYANAIFSFSSTRTLVFPADFASTTFPQTNSTAGCVTAPSESDTWTLKDITAGTTVGTAALGTTCTTTGINTGVTFATTGHIAVTVAAGHFMEVVGPATVSGAHQSITFAASTPS